MLLSHARVLIILAKQECLGLLQGEATPMPIIEVVQRIEVPDMPDVDLPYEDGEPLESNWHRLQINLLGDVLRQHWPECTDFFAGGNMFVYYSLEQARNRDYKGPDFFVVLGVDGVRPRHSWIVWQEQGRYPDVIVELLSPTTMSEDLGPKKDLYERVFKTADYFCVNPDDWSLRGWRLGNMHYVALQPDPRGTLSKVGQLLELYGNRKVLIIGHSDGLGAATYNQRLSERQAAAVRQFLIDHSGAIPTLLTAEGMGDSRPVVSEATAEGRNANRRVEVVILN